MSLQRFSLATKLAACGALVLCVALAAFVLLANGGTSSANAQQKGSYAVTFDGEKYSGGSTVAATKPVVQRDSEEKYASPEPEDAKPHRIAELPAASTTSAPAKGSRDSKELRALIKKQKNSVKTARGDQVELASDGTALAPLGAPPEVQNVIAAANVIAKFPYIWGGGHGSFQARGYDCSGSVSYALKAAGLVETTHVSGEYESWGEPGPGEWITIYANGGHMFMVVGGLRYDTSFRDGPRGSRWQTAPRNMKGFTVRHPRGL